MPQLINPRHERFVRHWLKHGNASKAYGEAGYQATTRSSLDSSASALLRNPKIVSRINELRRSMAQKTEISLQSLLSDLAEDRALARSLGQVSAAVQATQLSAKLTGHLVDRKETGSPGDFAGLKSPGEVLDVIRRELGDAAASAIEAALAPAQAQDEASPELDSIPEPTDKSLN